jgi:hypothetical protein
MVMSRRLLALAWATTLAGCAGGGAAAVVAPPQAPVETLPVLTTLAVVLPSDSLAAGQALPISVAAFDQKARPMTVGLVAYSSSNPLVARLSPGGALLCLAPGTTTISASVGDVTGRRIVAITALPAGPLPVADVVVSPFATVIAVGASRAVTARIQDFAGNTLSGRDVTWSTSNDAVAIVSASGVVTARAPGVALVEATSEGRRGAMQVSVPTPVDSSIVVTVATPLPASTIGDTVTVSATVRSDYPIVSVAMLIGGIPIELVRTPVGALLTGTAWVALADLSTLPFGSNSIVVTATDSRGKSGVLVVPFSHDPRVLGGGLKPPTSNK